MLQQFIAHVAQQHLFPTGQQVLLAVSGGIDSVVLSHLMHRAHYPFAIAHCNFNLRPGDCDRDELFVRNLALQYGVPFHVQHFQTLDYAHTHKLSVEDAARRLRYDWFLTLCQTHGYPALLTAHHRDDSNETFFLNLLRGTGLSGLHGILPVQAHVVRPLLPFGRDDIEAYASRHHLDHVEDLTNASLDYRRNQVRHQLLPLLRQLQPAADRTVSATIVHLQSAEHLYQVLLQPLTKQLLSSLPDGTYRLSLNFADLLPALAQPNLRFQLLFEMLHPLGFNSATVATISAATRSGSRFYTPSHCAILDRDALLITPLSAAPASELLPKIHLQSIPISDLTLNPRSLPPTQALFDADTVRLPLSLRHWRQGDRFQPFGMSHGSQLLSDFFSNHKFSLLDKQRQLLLVDSTDAILWVVGHRTSHPHRISPATRFALLVSLLPVPAPSL